MSVCYKCKSNRTVGQVHLANGAVEEACRNCRDSFHDGMKRGGLAEFHRVKALLEAAGMSETKVLEIMGRP